MRESKVQANWVAVMLGGILILAAARLDWIHDEIAQYHGAVWHQWPSFAVVILLPAVAIAFVHLLWQRRNARGIGSYRSIRVALFCAVIFASEAITSRNAPGRLWVHLVTCSLALVWVLFKSLQTRTKTAKPAAV